MRTLTRALSLASVLISATATAADLKPYEIIWRADEGVLADLSFLLDAPAGKHGFMTARDGHLYWSNTGARARIWGVNFSFTASLPAKEAAPHVAAHLARFGINSIRVHHLDWRTPRGIIDSKHPDSRHLDPDMLDRLDFLVSELKKKGIYTNLNLNIARSFQAADGVKDASELGYAKGLTYFDPRIIELQKEYARTLLAHKNPYTGSEYRNEPAIAIIEIVNENSLIESWVRGRLQGKGLTKSQDKTWTDIPESYAKDLDRLFAVWLAKRGKPAVARMRPEEFKQASPERFRTEAEFYTSLEDGFFQDMYHYLKQDLGVKMPVVGTSVHAGGLTPYPLLGSTAKLDIVDAHTYWQHPRYLSDPSGKRIGFEITNTPSVNDPAHSAIATLSRAAVAGKPFMVSEVNHPYPNEFASEGIPLLAAYAAFQDWDAIYWYSFAHMAGEQWDQPRLPNHFDMRQDPVKMTQWAAGALIFLRGDIAAAKKTIARSYTTDQVLDSLLLPASEQPYFTPGFPPLLPLVRGSRVAAFAGKPTDRVELTAGPIITSDTGQLVWNVSTPNRGVVSVDAPRAQCLIGYTDGARPLKNMSASLKNSFASLMLVSMEQAAIAKAGRMLLVAGARTGNAGIVWNDKRTSLTDMGKPGMTIEPVEGTLTLKLDGAKMVEAVPLDGAGRPVGPAIKGVPAGGGFQIELGATTTPWYLIQVKR